MVPKNVKMLIAVVLKLLRKIFHLSHRRKTKRKIWEVAVVTALADGLNVSMKRGHWSSLFFLFHALNDLSILWKYHLLWSLFCWLCTVECMWVMLKCIVAGLVSPVNIHVKYSPNSCLEAPSPPPYSQHQILPPFLTQFCTAYFSGIRGGGGWN